jgi:lipid II:glycine glycyltransferase (peptidoglycan interpeptide bridge formation enzyme)
MTAAAPTATLIRTDDAAWDRFVAEAAAPSFLQATPWGVVKRPNGWRPARVVVDAAQGPVGAQVLVRHPRPLPKGFGYAARGPLSGVPLDAESLRAFGDAARLAAPGLGIAHLRIDPELEDSDGSIAASLRDAGWRPAPDIQPPTTRVIDLDRPEEAIWADVRKKTRQLVRRAERDGVVVVSGGLERIPDLHRVLATTMERVGLPFRTVGFYSDLWSAYAATDRAMLLLAEADGEVLSASLLIGWGPRIVALYGGTTPAGRRLEAKYALNWEVLRRARAAGYRTYDAWGLPNEGIAFFKAGWGGREVRYVGAWDLVVDPAGAALFERAVRARAIVGRLRRRLAGGLVQDSGEDTGDAA